VEKAGGAVQAENLMADKRAMPDAGERAGIGGDAWWAARDGSLIKHSLSMLYAEMMAKGRI
jgi:hypothetical protein